jgi:hypothetical protein
MPHSFGSDKQPLSSPQPRRRGIFRRFSTFKFAVTRTRVLLRFISPRAHKLGQNTSGAPSDSVFYPSASQFYPQLEARKLGQNTGRASSDSESLFYRPSDSESLFYRPSASRFSWEG